MSRTPKRDFEFIEMVKESKQEFLAIRSLCQVIELKLEAVQRKLGDFDRRIRWMEDDLKRDEQNT